MVERIQAMAAGVVLSPSRFRQAAVALLGVALLSHLLFATFVSATPLRLTLLLLVDIGIAAAIYTAWQTRRQQTAASLRPVAADGLTMDEYARLQQRYGGAMKQLDAAIDDNVELREALLAAHESALGAVTLERAVLESSNEAVLALDTEQRIIGLSPRSAALLRVDGAAVRGQALDAVAKIYDIDRDPKRRRALASFTAEEQEARRRIPRAMLDFGVEEELLIDLTLLFARDEQQQVRGVLLRFGGEATGAAPGPAALTAAASSAAAAAENGDTALAHRDPLTGLLSVQAFDQRLAELMDIARRFRVQHSLMLISLDALDVVNRELGSNASEDLLRDVADILQGRIAALGDLYRVSLYNYGALIPELCGDPARELAEAMRADIAGYTLRRADKHFNATISIALLEIDEHTESADDLLRNANDVLLEAAVAGGDRVSVYQGNVQRRQSVRRDDRQWIDWLMPRFDRKLVHLVSQSIVPVAGSGARPWVEVFVRVEEDDGHWLPPGAYLPALRRNRLTPKLDLWVLEQALGAIATNRELFEKYAGITINLDNASVSSSEFRNAAAERLANAGTAATQICFEIDEACVANRSSHLIELYGSLHVLGTHFLLDHCRGADTIALLRKVPVEFIKFHESLVRRAMSDAVDRSELEWLNQAAHLLNRQTVASHVESKELRELLTRIGVDYVQGLAIDQLGPLLI